MTESIEVFLKDIDDPALRWEMAEALYLFRDEEKDAAYERITDNLELLFGAMQIDLVKHIQNVSDEASQKWDDMGFWGRLGKTKAGCVALAIERFRKDTMDPVSDGINEILADFSIEGGKEMQRAVDNILAEGFVHGISGNYIEYFGEDISKLTTDEIAKMESLFGEKAKTMGAAIPTEMSGGIGSNLEKLIRILGIQNTTVDTELSATNRTVSDKLSEMSSNMNTSKIQPTWKNLWKPFGSTVNTEMAQANKQLGGGISDLVNKLKKNNISSAWGSIWDKLSAPKIKLPHFSITGGFSLSPLSIPKISVEWYASGGFPDVGELFVAREAGPELVGSIGGRTAVANNDQIVTAVSEGVAKAVSKVLGQGGSSGDVVLQVGETELGRVVIDSINKLQKQEGKILLEL